MKKLILTVVFAVVFAALLVEARCSKYGFHVAGPLTCMSWTQSLSGDWEFFTTPLDDLEAWKKTRQPSLHEIYENRSGPYHF